MKCHKIYTFTEEKIGSVFSKYGRFVSRHAWKILIICIVINSALAVGVYKLESEIDAVKIYLPSGTRARDEQEIVENTFPDLTGKSYSSFREVNQYGIFARVIVRAKTGKLLSRTNLEKIGELNSIIQGISVRDESGANITFSSICARLLGECLVEGSLFWSEQFLSAVDNNSVSYPLFLLPVVGPVEYATLCGGNVELDPTGSLLRSVEYLHIRYSFRTDFEESLEQTKAWVDVFKNRLLDYMSDDLDIAFGHYNSLNEELDKNVAGDILLFTLTIALMMLYAGIATFTARFTNQVSQRLVLGLAGILTAGLAIAASFGLCAASGVEFVSIVGVVPFLVVGIGIDDMFIMLSGLSGAQDKTTVEDKMAETMRSSGVGITITSLTDLLAFFVGSFSNYTAVSNFCIYTGVAVFFCYINNVTFYAACIAINERRVKENRHFLTCQKVRSKGRLKYERKSPTYIFCCSGRPPKNRDEAESYFDKLPRWLIPKIVLKLPFKLLIIILFMCYLAAGIYGCINLEQGLLFTQLLADDSYFHKYSTLSETVFPRQVPLSFVITETYQYSDPRTKILLDNLIATAKNNSYISNDFEVNWLTTYMNTGYFNDSTESSFIQGLKSFFNNTLFTVFENDVVIDELNMKITASRVHIVSRDLEDSQAEGQLMMELREIADSADIKSFAYSPLFVIAEQYISILPQSLQSVGIALAAVFVITCIFMPHPVLITFVTVAVTMIMVGVFGYMYYVDVSLSAITMVHLIMSVGFSIDFTAHICHGYLVANGNDRDTRVQQAIDETGAPIFHGAVSSLIGIASLAAAKSYVFRTFATVMAFVLAFGIAHALLLLPVLLSWIGPGQLQKGTDVKSGKRVHMNGYAVNGMNNKGAILNDEPTSYLWHKKDRRLWIQPYREYRNGSEDIFHLNQRISLPHLKQLGEKWDELRFKKPLY